MHNLWVLWLFPVENDFKKINYKIWAGGHLKKANRGN